MATTTATTGETTPEAFAAVGPPRHCLYNLNVKTADGTGVIRTTAAHLFWNPAKKKRVQASKLKKGEHLRTADGKDAVAGGGTTPATHDGCWAGCLVPPFRLLLMDMELRQEIEPLAGVGGVLFGSTRAIVRNSLGRPDEVVRKPNWNPQPTDVYLRLGRSFSYDADGLLAEVHCDGRDRQCRFASPRHEEADIFAGQADLGFPLNVTEGVLSEGTHAF